MTEKGKVKMNKPKKYQNERNTISTDYPLDLDNLWDEKRTIKQRQMKETLGMIKFFFISVPVFLLVYCTVMIYVELKELYE